TRPACRLLPRPTNCSAASPTWPPLLLTQQQQNQQSGPGEDDADSIDANDGDAAAAIAVLKILSTAPNEIPREERRNFCCGFSSHSNIVSLELHKNSLEIWTPSMATTFRVMMGLVTVFENVIFRGFAIFSGLRCPRLKRRTRVRFRARPHSLGACVQENWPARCHAIRSHVRASPKAQKVYSLTSRKSAEWAEIARSVGCETMSLPIGISIQNGPLNFSHRQAVCDFGFAKQLRADNGLLMTPCYTASFVALRCSNCRAIRPPATSGAPGCCCTPCWPDRLRTRTAPADPAEEILNRIETGSVELEGGNWESVSPAAKDLVRRMLHVDPSQRITAAQVLQHTWVAHRSALPMFRLAVRQEAGQMLGAMRATFAAVNSTSTGAGNSGRGGAGRQAAQVPALQSVAASDLAKRRGKSKPKIPLCPSLPAAIRCRSQFILVLLTKRKPNCNRFAINLCTNARQVQFLHSR
uniref:Protein kinase domain-containing protein n=1 Tax=Macrostomum lignano TaxID=282301 RepID=A0A1I8FJF7_9PLAT